MHQGKVSPACITLCKRGSAAPHNLTLDSNGNKYLVSNFQHVFHTWYEKLHRYAYTLLKDPDEASDAVQAVFSKVWEKQELLEDGENPGPYLYRAVHNHCLNRIRKEDYGRKYASWLAHHANGIHAGDAGGKLAVAELSARIGKPWTHCRRNAASSSR